MKTNRKTSKNRKTKTLKVRKARRPLGKRAARAQKHATAFLKTRKATRKGNQDSPITTLKKLRKLQAKCEAMDNGEAIAEQDFNNEIKLSGWKAINKTWTRGKIARFKASKYVRDLQNRIKDLKKKVVVFS